MRRKMSESVAGVLGTLGAHLLLSRRRIRPSMREGKDMGIDLARALAKLAPAEWLEILVVGYLQLRSRR